MSLRGRLVHLSGWLLGAGGVLYGVLWGASAAGVGPGDDYWMLTLFIHMLSIAAITVGLAASRSALGIESWGATVWWISTALALVGNTVGHPFFSFAVFGLAAVAFSRLRFPWLAALLASGGGLWLYLFAAGVRFGDENARPHTGTEELLGVIAVISMALGLVGLGWAAVRRRWWRPGDAVPLTAPPRA